MKSNATHTGLTTAVLRKSGYSMHWSLHQVLEENRCVNKCNSQLEEMSRESGFCGELFLFNH